MQRKNLVQEVLLCATQPLSSDEQPCSHIQYLQHIRLDGHLSGLKYIPVHVHIFCLLDDADLITLNLIFSTT